jgi:hypothetical protein
MKVPCYSCNTVTELEIGFEVVNFVCPNCHSLYLSDNEGQLRLKSKFKSEIKNFTFKIGDKGVLKAVEYTVVAALVKQVGEGYRWTEYILKSAKDDFVYLSESDGNWIFLTEMVEKFSVNQHPKTIIHNGDIFDIYEYCDVEIENAQGYFDFSLPVKKVHMVEYIHPPLMISIEKINDDETAFLGEYISQSEIKKGFPTADLPYQTGVNITRPYYFDLQNTAIIFCVVALMIICTNWYIYKDQSEQSVFYKEATFDEFNNKEIFGSSFVLKGGSAPLTVYVSSDVDNSWANIDVALVNEDTNEELHANKDVEYYHGYTDGENWTEGNPSEEFNICGVKAGKYHLVITPQKAPEDISNNVVRVNVVWNKPSLYNTWIIIGFMIVVYIVIRYCKINFEKKRWEHSDYSPYQERVI